MYAIRNYDIKDSVHINLKTSTVALQLTVKKWKTTAVSSDNSEEQHKSRGVKRGTNRGKYKRNSYEKKLIVDGDWRAVAKSQEISV